MSISHRTNRLKLVGQPSVEQLQNGRYRLTVNCTAINSREDWYSVNKDRILPDFGSLQSAEMSIDGLAAREGEAYTDMRLTKVASGNRSGMGAVGDYNVELTYETLGSAFVQVKDDTTDYELNGLRRVTRTSIAEAGTDYAKTVGTSFIDHQINNETAVRCYLASYSVDDNDSFRQVQEVYVEAGILSETLDNVGSQKAKVIETIGTDPITPTGYSLASKKESDFEGLQTNRFTFLKDNVVLSESEDKVGSQLAIVKEVFNGTPTTPSGYSIANTQESDVDGIPTRRFTLLKNNVELSRSEDRVGSQLAITTEVFNPEEDPAEDGYDVARVEVSDVDGIPTKRFTFLKDGAVMSESRTSESDGVFKVTKVFFNTAGVTVGPIISQRTDDVDGIPTISITTLQDVDGNSIVTGGENMVNQVSGFSPFSYPGVLNVDVDQITNGGGGDWLRVKALLIDAPAQCKVKTTTYFIFQAANSIVASDYKYASSTGLWSPNHWAAFSISASGTSEGGLFSDSSTFRGYRTSSDSDSGSLDGPLLSSAQLSWQGRTVLFDFEEITYDLVIDQGPPDPIGSTYTLDVQITPAFDDIDGNQYYKKTIVVTDAIPSQPNTASLPYS